MLSLTSIFGKLKVSIVYTALLFDLIKNQLIDLMDHNFRREKVLYLACNAERACFTSEEHKMYNLCAYQKVTEAHVCLLDNINIRFDTKFYRQNVGIPMGTNRPPPPLVAGVFLFCFERDFMKSLAKEKGMT